jgi:hypothetical protein
MNLTIHYLDIYFLGYSPSSRNTESRFIETMDVCEQSSVATYKTFQEKTDDTHKQICLPNL